LGDFNRSDREVAHDAFWRTLEGDDPSQATYVSIGAEVPFRNCYIGAPFTRAIDHVLVARTLKYAVITGSYRRFGYRNLEAMRYRLSDHCPVRVSLNPPVGAR